MRPRPQFVFPCWSGRAGAWQAPLLESDWIHRCWWHITKDVRGQDGILSLTSTQPAAYAAAWFSGRSVTPADGWAEITLATSVHCVNGPKQHLNADFAFSRRSDAVKSIWMMLTAFCRIPLHDFVYGGIYRTVFQRHRDTHLAWPWGGRGPLRFPRPTRFVHPVMTDDHRQATRWWRWPLRHSGARLHRLHRPLMGIFWNNIRAIEPAGERGGYYLSLSRGHFPLSCYLQ